MESTDLIMIISRLITGAGATFVAIILWSTTRDTAWMLVIMGTILRYGGIVYTTFGLFGLVPEDVVLVAGYLSVETLLVNLPLIFYAAGFIVMIRRNRAGL